jgi:Holliday junction resolvasome RuvABC endonuclease subunit
MAILAIDPGIVVAAYCVFDDNGVPIEFGDIKFNTKRTQEQRFWEFFSKLREISARHTITQIIAESQFVNIMSQIVGMIMAFSGSVDVKLIKFVPSAWKKSATGRGNIPEDELRTFIIDKYSSLANVSEHVIDCAGMYEAYVNKIKNAPTAVVKPKKKISKKKGNTDAESVVSSSKKKKSS